MSYSAGRIHVLRSLHICLTSLQSREGFVEELVNDLRKAIEDVRANPTPVEGVVSIAVLCACDWMFMNLLRLTVW